MSKAVWHRRSLLLAAMGSLAGAHAAVPPVAESGGRFLPRVKIALAASQSLYHLPLTLADQLGYFRQAGIAVVWMSHESGARALSSVLSTQADVLAGSFDHLFVLQQRDRVFSVLCNRGEPPRSAWGSARARRWLVVR